MQSECTGHRFESRWGLPSQLLKLKLRWLNLNFKHHSNTDEEIRAIVTLFYSTWMAKNTADTLRDQNPQFTPIREATSIPDPFAQKPPRSKGEPPILFATSLKIGILFESSHHSKRIHVGLWEGAGNTLVFFNRSLLSWLLCRTWAFEADLRTCVI